MFFNLISMTEVAGTSAWLSLVTPAFPEVEAGAFMTAGISIQGLASGSVINFKLVILNCCSEA